MDEPVVGASPEYALAVRRLGQGEDRAVDLGTGVVPRYRPTGRLQLVRVVPSQIRADDLPTAAEVGRAEKDIAGDIELVRGMRREQNREGPIEPVLEALRADSPTIQFRPDRDIADLAGAVVVVGHDVVVSVASGGTGGHDVPRLV